MLETFSDIAEADGCIDFYFFNYKWRRANLEVMTRTIVRL